MLKQILIIICLLPLCGCSNLNCTRLESLLGGDVNLVKLSNDIGDLLIKRAFPPLLPRQPEQPVLLTSLVNNNNLYETTDFGRAMTNHIASRFVQNGFTVKEIKLRESLLIRENDGEFMLSGNLDEIIGKQRSQAIVVGTYTVANRIMYLSIRLVDSKTRTIRASYDERLCLDENTLRMLGLQFEEDRAIRPPRESRIDQMFY